MSVLGTVLVIVALVLAVIALLQARLQSVGAWAVVALAVGVLLLTGIASLPC